MKLRLPSAGKRVLVHLALLGLLCNLQLLQARVQEDGKLTIKREWAWSNSANNVKVYVNDQFLGELSNGKQETLHIHSE